MRYSRVLLLLVWAVLSVAVLEARQFHSIQRSLIQQGPLPVVGKVVTNPGPAQFSYTTTVQIDATVPATLAALADNWSKVRYHSTLHTTPIITFFLPCILMLFSVILYI